MSIDDSDYEGAFYISSPVGVYQASGDTNISLNYAYKAENLRTDNGVLATCYGTSLAFPSLWARVDTLCRFYRRTIGDEIFIAVASNSLHYYDLSSGEWMDIDLDVQLTDGKFTYITYEAVHGEATTDILLLSNVSHGMIAIYGDTLTAEMVTPKIGDEYEGVKFSCIARYAERIWGVGDPNNPDSVFYSCPYDPLDWTQNNDNPELGGGVINQPTWDGESFISVNPFGGYLLAIKPSTIYEIRGTDPSSYTITQGYGCDSAIAPRSIQADITNMLYLSQDGIGLYNGTSAALLSKDALMETMAGIGNTDLACSCMCKHVYYLAICVETNGMLPSWNNVLITYDMDRGAFMVRTGLCISNLYALNGKVYFTSALGPEYDICLLGDPDTNGDLGAPIVSTWQTAWYDLGRRAQKEDFVLRFTAEATDENTPIWVQIENEKGRTKRKTVMLHRARMDYRVRIGMRAKRLRITVQSDASQVTGWKLYGGIDINYTYDSVYEKGV